MWEELRGDPSSEREIRRSGRPRGVQGVGNSRWLRRGAVMREERVGVCAGRAKQRSMLSGVCVGRGCVKCV